MLPDYPETKRLFSRFFQTRMRLKAQQISPFGTVRIRHYHEGRAFHIVRSDNSESESEAERFAVEGMVKMEEIPTQTFESVLQRFDEITVQMVRQQTEYVMQRLGEDLPESQTVDAKGKQLDAELLLDTLDAIQIEFDEDGTMHTLHVVGGLFTPEAFAALDKQMAESPELQKRHQELMARKKEEWRAREADRKLVG